MKARVVIPLVLTAVVCGLFACSEGKRNQEPVYPERETKLPDLKSAGSVSGRVLFQGKPPRRSKIRMSDAACAHEKALDESVIVGENAGLQNVALVITKGLEGYVFPYVKEPFVVDQVGCVYKPHVVMVRAYQPVIFGSSDTTRHNVKTSHIKHNPAFNFSMSKGEKITRQFAKPEHGIRVMCDLHTWMEAYIHVMDHPYFSLSNEKGEFSIGDLPPGSYTLTAYHEKLGTREFSFELGASQTLRLDDTSFVFGK